MNGKTCVSIRRRAIALRLVCADVAAPQRQRRPLDFSAGLSQVRKKRGPTRRAVCTADARTQ